VDEDCIGLSSICYCTEVHLQISEGIGRVEKSIEWQRVELPESLCPPQFPAQLQPFGNIDILGDPIALLFQRFSGRPSFPLRSG
jgi:hypothetical protein